jgi:putative hemolysin
VPNDNNAIIKGVENYQAAQERVRSSLEALKSASTTPGFDKLMNSVANDVVLHQKVLDEIGIKASDSTDVKNAVDSAKVKIDESAATAAQNNPTDFANKLQNALIESRGSELKHVRSVEIINNIEARAPEAAKPALLKVQENLTNKLNESIQQATDASGPAAVQQLIKEIPSNDSVQRAVTVKQLQQIIVAPSVKAGGGGGGSAVSVVSACDTLKQSLEQLKSSLKAGALTEEQYNLKYEAIKKELEQCISKQQSQQTTAISVKKEAPVSSCESLKKYLSDLELMMKNGQINQADYQYKSGVINQELKNCSNAFVNVQKPEGQVYCTMEAKLCSDGSYVARTGPKCEFALCPGQPGYSNSPVNSFSDVYVQCYDGKELKDSVSSCKTSEDWQAYAKKFCEGHCYADNSKCGVNTFGISNECRIIAPSSAAGVSVPVIQDCGKENEKLNRDSLAGPVTKQCCYGLKEDRSNKSYSICIKSGENSDTSAETIINSNVPAVSGIANPASVYCVKQGYKNEIRTNADGSQYGVCIFKDGSECEEWKFYKNECKESNSLNTGSSINIGTTTIKVACPMFAPVSPEVVKACSEKGGKMAATQDANGCYSPPKCVLSAASTSNSSSQ